MRYDVKKEIYGVISDDGLSISQKISKIKDIYNSSNGGSAESSQYSGDNGVDDGNINQSQSPSNQSVNQSGSQQQAQQSGQQSSQSNQQSSQQSGQQGQQSSQQMGQESVNSTQNAVNNAQNAANKAQQSSESGSADDAAKSAQQAADAAQQAANAAQQAADTAQQIAQQSGSKSAQQAANAAQQAANDAQDAADSAQDAADSAQQAANDGDTKSAQRSAQQAANAAQQAANAAQQAANAVQQASQQNGSSNQSANNAHQSANSTQQSSQNDSAQQAAQQAQQAADDAQQAAQQAQQIAQQSGSKSAQQAAQQAQQAAQQAQQAAQQAQQAADNGNPSDAQRSAQQAANAAHQAANSAQQAVQQATQQSGNQSSSQQQAQQSGQQSSQSNQQSSQQSNQNSQNNQQSSNGSNSSNQQSSNGMPSPSDEDVDIEYIIGKEYGKRFAEEFYANKGFAPLWSNMVDIPDVDDMRIIESLKESIDDDLYDILSNKDISNDDAVIKIHDLYFGSSNRGTTDEKNDIKKSKIPKDAIISRNGLFSVKDGQYATDEHVISKSIGDEIRKELGVTPKDPDFGMSDDETAAVSEAFPILDRVFKANRVTDPEILDAGNRMREKIKGRIRQSREGVIDWKRALTKFVSSKSKKTKAGPIRKNIYKLSGVAVKQRVRDLTNYNKCVVYIDTSYSVNNPQTQLIPVMAGEICKIMRDCNFKTVDIHLFDDAVYAEHFDVDANKVKNRDWGVEDATEGGGTDIQLVYKHIEDNYSVGGRLKNNVDAIIIITDVSGMSDSGSIKPFIDKFGTDLLRRMLYVIYNDYPGVYLSEITDSMNHLVSEYSTHYEISLEAFKKQILNEDMKTKFTKINKIDEILGSANDIKKTMNRPVVDKGSRSEEEANAKLKKIDIQYRRDNDTLEEIAGDILDAVNNAFPNFKMVKEMSAVFNNQDVYYITDELHVVISSDFSRSRGNRRDYVDKIRNLIELSSKVIIDSVVGNVSLVGLQGVSRLPKGFTSICIEGDLNIDYCDGLMNVEGMSTLPYNVKGKVVIRVPMQFEVEKDLMDEFNAGVEQYKAKVTKYVQDFLVMGSMDDNGIVKDIFQKGVNDTNESLVEIVRNRIHLGESYLAEAFPSNLPLSKSFFDKASRDTYKDYMSGAKRDIERYNRNLYPRKVLLDMPKKQTERKEFLSKLFTDDDFAKKYRFDKDAYERNKRSIDTYYDTDNTPIGVRDVSKEAEDAAKKMKEASKKIYDENMTIFNMLLNNENYGLFNINWGDLKKSQIKVHHLVGSERTSFFAKSNRSLSTGAGLKMFCDSNYLIRIIYAQKGSYTNVLLMGDSNGNYTTNRDEIDEIMKERNALVVGLVDTLKDKYGLALNEIAYEKYGTLLYAIFLLVYKVVSMSLGCAFGKSVSNVSTSILDFPINSVDDAADVFGVSSYIIKIDDKRLGQGKKAMTFYNNGSNGWNFDAIYKAFEIYRNASKDLKSMLKSLNPDFLRTILIGAAVRFPDKYSDYSPEEISNISNPDELVDIAYEWKDVQVENSLLKCFSGTQKVIDVKGLANDTVGFESGYLIKYPDYSEWLYEIDVDVVDDIKQREEESKNRFAERVANTNIDDLSKYFDDGGLMYEYGSRAKLFSKLLSNQSDMDMYVNIIDSNGLGDGSQFVNGVESANVYMNAILQEVLPYADRLRGAKGGDFIDAFKMVLQQKFGKTGSNADDIIDDFNGMFYDCDDALVNILSAGKRNDTRRIRSAYRTFVDIVEKELPDYYENVFGRKNVYGAVKNRPAKTNAVDINKIKSDFENIKNKLMKIADLGQNRIPYFLNTINMSLSNLIDNVKSINGISANDKRTIDDFAYDLNQYWNRRVPSTAKEISPKIADAISNSVEELDGYLNGGDIAVSNVG